MYLSTPSFVLTVFYSDYDNGKLISDGKAVIIKVSSIDMLVSYVEDMSKSLSTSDMLFEATAVTITPVDTQTTESSREEIFSTADIPTNANHTQATREEISPTAEISDNSGHTLSSILIVLSMSIDVSVDTFICVDCLLFRLFFQCPLMYLSTPSFVLTVFYSDCSFNVH
jgi:hypothetical protein